MIFHLSLSLSLSLSIYIYIYKYVWMNLYIQQSIYLSIYMLWPFRHQKEDMEEEKVGGTSVLNKQNLYTR